MTRAALNKRLWEKIPIGSTSTDKDLPASPLTKWVLPAGLIILITLLVYVPAMQSGFIWDDDAYVTENQALRSVEGLAHIWTDPGATPQYYPLVFTTFWIEYRLWEFSPAGFHSVNVLLHAFNALLLWGLLRTLNVPGAWMAAAVFALHPVHVESVAWVTERKNVLSVLFYLASMACLVRFFALVVEKNLQNNKLTYTVGLLLFMAALLSKTVTCTLPAAMMLLIWWKRGRVTGREVAALAPFFVIGLIMGLMTVWLEQHHVGAMGKDWELTLLERCLLAGRVLWFYAAKLVWPANLIFNYPRWEIDALIWWQYLYPIGAVGVVVFLWKFRRRLGRGPLAGMLYFCGSLFPALGFFDVYPFRFSYVADHFQYLASIGLIVLLVAAFTQFRLAFPRWQPGLAQTLGLIVLAVFGTLTWQQSQIYKTAQTLWQDTLKKNPDSWLAHNNMGVLFERRGNIDEAFYHYTQRLRLQPGHAKAHYNLGVVLTRQEKYEEAVQHFSQALQIRPDYAEAHNNLGIALARQGKLEEAIHHYSEALRFQPDYAETHNNLGTTLAGQGKYVKATDHYLQALRIRPDYAEAHNNIGTALARQGKLEEAMGHFRQALQITPDYPEAHNNLGVAWSQRGDHRRAIEHFLDAVAIDPGYAEARANLSLNYWLKGNKEKAEQEYEIVKNLNPHLAARLQEMMAESR